MDLISTKNLLLKSRVGRAVSGAAAIGSVAAVVVASSVMPTAAAPTPGTLVANGITSPTGMLWLPGATAGSGHFWVADHAQGLCRLDGPVGSATLTNCDLTVKSIGQPAFDPTRNFVYVPDNAAKSSGVWRLTFDPVTETMGGGGGGGGVFGGGAGGSAPVNLAPGRNFGSNRPFAVAVDPNNDYALYIGFRKTPQITRLSKPFDGAGDAPNTIATVGNSADNRQVRAMTMVSHITSPGVATSALLVMDGNGIGAIADPKSCPQRGNCNAIAQAALANTAALPLGIGSDNNVLPNTESSIAYIPDTTGVLFKWDTVSGAVTSLSSGLSFPTAVGFRASPAPNVYVGDDPSQGNSIGAGHVYSIP